MGVVDDSKQRQQKTVKSGNAQETKMRLTWDEWGVAVFIGLFAFVVFAYMFVQYTMLTVRCPTSDGYSRRVVRFD